MTIPADYSVYTGAAMSFLQGYATNAYTAAKTYLDALYNYTSQEVDTSGVPSINIDVTQSIEVDPSLSAAIPEAPSDSEYPVSPTGPSIGSYDFPTRPTYALPVAPTLSDIVIPDFVEGTIGSITTSIPVMSFDVPPGTEITTSNVSEDSLLQTIKARLEGNILYGGTMLNPSVEADIWNRNLERDEQTLQDSIDKMTGQWAKLGFSAPDGLLAGSFIAINNEYYNKKLDRSREIAIKQAEMEHQGLFKSYELGISIENIVMTSQNEYAKRVLDASKFTADQTIVLFKERVNRYNALLETYKADVLAYKTGIEAEMVRAETYKARISGAQVLAQVDETRVKAYAAHIGAIGQLVDLYNTEVKAVATMYEVEKTKIELFKSQVEAYVAQIEGVTKKYLAEVEGYKGYIQAWAASADSKTKLIELSTRAQIAELEAAIKQWEIQLKLIQDGTQVKLEALRTVAQTASNLAAGALSAIHASVSDSYQNSYSRSVSSQL